MASVRLECGVSNEQFDDFDGGVPTSVIDCGATDYDITDNDDTYIELHGKNWSYKDIISM